MACGEKASMCSRTLEMLPSRPCRSECNSPGGRPLLAGLSTLLSESVGKSSSVYYVAVLKLIAPDQAGSGSPGPPAFMRWRPAQCPAPTPDMSVKGGLF